MTSNIRAWRSKRQEDRRRCRRHALVAAWEVCIEFIAALVVETIEAASKVAFSLAGALSILSERYKLWTRISLAVALGIGVSATYLAYFVIARVFGPNPPAVPEHTATALGYVAGLVSALTAAAATVAGWYIHKRAKEDGHE